MFTLVLPKFQFSQIGPSKFQFHAGPSNSSWSFIKFQCFYWSFQIPILWIGPSKSRLVLHNTNFHKLVLQNSSFTLVLQNPNCSFQNSNVYIGPSKISNFHKLVLPKFQFYAGPSKFQLVLHQIPMFSLVLPNSNSMNWSFQNSNVYIGPSKFQFSQIGPSKFQFHAGPSNSNWSFIKFQCFHWSFQIPILNWSFKIPMFTLVLPKYQFSQIGPSKFQFHAGPSNSSWSFIKFQCFYWSFQIPILWIGPSKFQCLIGPS